MINEVFTLSALPIAALFMLALCSASSAGIAHRSARAHGAADDEYNERNGGEVKAVHHGSLPSALAASMNRLGEASRQRQASRP